MLKNVLIIILLCGWNLGYSNIYYISPKGSDHNDGSEFSPFKSVDKAFKLLGPNTTLIFEDGEYPISQKIQIEKVKGTMLKKINILAKNIGKVTFIIDKNIQNENITFRDCSNIKFEGINFVGNGKEVRNTHNILLAIRNCKNIIIKSCSFSNSYEEGLKVSKSSHIKVYDNDFYNFSHEAIDFLNVQNSIIYKNRIRNIGRVGIMVKGGSESVVIVMNKIWNTDIFMNTAAITIGGMTDKNSARNYRKGSFEAYYIYAIHNEIDGNQQRINTGIAFFGAKDSFSLGNKIKSTKYGIEVVKNNSIEYGWDENVNNTNITIADNLFENIKEKGMRILNKPKTSKNIANKINSLNYQQQQIKFNKQELTLDYLLNNIDDNAL